MSCPVLFVEFFNADLFFPPPKISSVSYLNEKVFSFATPTPSPFKYSVSVKIFPLTGGFPLLPLQGPPKFSIEGRTCLLEPLLLQAETDTQVRSAPFFPRTGLILSVLFDYLGWYRVGVFEGG